MPHEIGIFLGIPLDDVTGFIESGGKNYLISGYWKVYSRTERPEAYFRLYDKTRIDMARLMMDNNMIWNTYMS